MFVGPGHIRAISSFGCNVRHKFKQSTVIVEPEIQLTPVPDRGHALKAHVYMFSYQKGCSFFLRNASAICKVSICGFLEVEQAID